MAITDVNVMDFGLYENILGGFDFGTDLLTIVVLAISAIIITRDTRNMRLLLLPLAVGWGRAGLPVPVWLITVSAIVSIVTLVGAHNIGATLNSIQETATKALKMGRTGTRWNINKEKQRMDQLYDTYEATSDRKASLGLQSNRFAQELKTAQEAIQNDENRQINYVPITSRLFKRKVNDYITNKYPYDKNTNTFYAPKIRKLLEKEGLDPKYTIPGTLSYSELLQGIKKYEK